jgi:hypothetical protein
MPFLYSEIFYPGIFYNLSTCGQVGFLQTLQGILKDETVPGSSQSQAP